MASINNFLTSVNQKNNAYCANLLFLDSNTFEQFNTSIKLQYFTSAVLSDSSVTSFHFNKHIVLNVFFCPKFLNGSMYTYLLILIFFLCFNEMGFFRISCYINVLSLNAFMQPLLLNCLPKFKLSEGIKFPNNYTEVCGNTIKFCIVICLNWTIMCWCIIENNVKLKQTAIIVKNAEIEVLPSFSSTISWRKLFQHVTGGILNAIIVPLTCGPFYMIPR